MFFFFLGLRKLFYFGYNNFLLTLLNKRVSLVAQLVRNLLAMQEILIPGSGRTPGEGIGYPFQYSWTSLVAQMIKNPSAMQETWIPSLKIPWRREQLPTPVFWPGEVHGAAKSQIQLNNFRFHFPCERQSAKQYQGLRELSTLYIVTI